MISEKNEKKTNRLLNEKIVKFCLIPGILRKMSTIFSHPVRCVTKRSQHNELLDFNDFLFLTENYVSCFLIFWLITVLMNCDMVILAIVCAEKAASGIARINLLYCPDKIT